MKPGDRLGEAQLAARLFRTLVREALKRPELRRIIEVSPTRLARAPASAGGTGATVPILENPSEKGTTP